jgi:hypothetical protein
MKMQWVAVPNAFVQRKSNFGYTQHIAPKKFTIIEGLLRESGKYLLKGQSFGQLYASPINNRLKSLVPFANGIMPDKTGFLIAFFSCIS